MNPLKFVKDRPFDIIAVGRLCIDLNANETNRPMEETSSFMKYVGGSPANIAIGSARLGQKTGFIGKVSDDQMGRFITNYLENKQIDTSGVKIDNSGAITGLTFTEIKSPEDCSILMYRDNVADLKLHPLEVDEEYIKQSKSLLISGTALAKSPSREAVFASEYAVKHSVTIFFDLDYRPYTWTDETETAIYYNLAAEKCDVIIGTREEFDMMEKLLNIDKPNDNYTASRWFSYRANLVVIKRGGEGSIAYTKDERSYRSGVFQSNVLKTFGAGDSYASAFIYGLMNGKDVAEAMKMGSASASIVISRQNRFLDAMPTEIELINHMENAVYEPAK